MNKSKLKVDTLSLPDLDSFDNPDLRNKDTYSIQFNDAYWGEPESDSERFVDEWHETGWIGEFHLDKVLSEAIVKGASDVYLQPDRTVSFSILGDSIKQPHIHIPSKQIMEYVIQGVLTKQAHGLYVRDLDYDGAYEIRFGPFKGRRFRVNIGYTFNENFAVFRVINEVIPSAKEIELEEEIIKWASYPDGLFLICGATGSGKSTTIASLIRDIQLREHKVIVTIERPIEAIYPDDGLATVLQRSVSDDVLTFENGLTAAMRQNPDIIVIGEVRNRAEVSELIRAAETGHLSISTMHTNSVATTINRIMSLFDSTDKGRIMNTLSDTLRGIANQVLVKGVDGNRFAVREILTINDEIKSLIANGDSEGVRQYQRRNQITMEHGLVQAVYEGKCTIESARKHTSYPEYFDSLLEDVGLV